MNKELQKLLNKLNRVTSCHRHGREIPERYLTELANAQVEYEEANQPDDSISETLNTLSQQIKDIRDGKVKASVVVEQDGDLTTVKLQVLRTGVRLCARGTELVLIEGHDDLYHICDGCTCQRDSNVLSR